MIIAPAWSRDTSEPTKPAALAERAIPSISLCVSRFGRDRGGDQRIGPEAFLGNLVDIGVRGPERLHPDRIHVWQGLHRLGHVEQVLQPGLGPDGSVPRPHHDGQAVGVEQLMAILQEGL